MLNVFFFLSESARAVTGTGRQCPHSGEQEDFLTRPPSFLFYENGHNSGTERRKIVPNMGNEPSLRGPLTKIGVVWQKIGFFGQKPRFPALKIFTFLL